ncbi:MAG: hypothetical protein UR17_C0001G0477 [Candidatus Woesebacteria bacterium GW2011_GWF1_31_35]|uniref:Uncharacterized protein n=1 Tax=Candidatus Woesebacteria bacterium GW2011_GWC2_31_9 TaxID=1618586 RepID=A0A0F9YIN9_9BACT|nr:MAG: hypothetical protein UR17_C0001G0477 [Candidatus Woesebacteria bacterium GW2011_GWF1_31_35]KKP23053.1 MAG: hypothetical protein UR11_C0001G0027 [Candidatus Woesebacteria bacterium GW2011_GWC1_30_29]KKP25343.1 MAG: hypothetical protein UR13_C0009G0027 [Candidatus Woesebacteria bacterium GW2011_GWD1_31_12]KKP27295.1 MAG: hypothetical protein UR16_C0004G0027 [Candidatus Woesebacteria bacterium GW2011_GWB1_31_29]KKP31218.1 MAG: hypothetical protein UR21_C0013G0012 [Candidatus Woesebacteria 
MKKLKRIPKFITEKEEGLFWQKADSTEYIDWSKAEKWVFPNLKLTPKPFVYTEIGE